MIDWWGLLSNAVWIFALAMLLATFSYQRYQKRRDSGFSETSRVDVWYRMGTLLFVMGQLFISTSRLEQAVWGILAVALIAEPAVVRLRQPQTVTDIPQQEEED